MLISNRIVRLLLDAAELHGVDRESVIRATGTSASELLADGARLEWGTITAAFDEVSRLVNGNEQSLRAIGRDMRQSNAPDVVRDVARGLLTPRSHYRFLESWMAPAFPHFSM